MRVFTALNWFLAYLEPNVWLKNPIFGKNAKVPRKVWFALSEQIVVIHNSAADWARELFKSSKVLGSLIDENKKTFKDLVLELLVNDVMIRVVLCFYDFIGDTMNRFRGLKFYWILGYNTSL